MTDDINTELDELEIIPPDIEATAFTLRDGEDAAVGIAIRDPADPDGEALIMETWQATTLAYRLLELADEINPRRKQNNGWDLLDAALAAARDLDALQYRDGGFKPGDLREFTNRLAEAVTAWKECLDRNMTNRHAEQPA